MDEFDLQLLQGVKSGYFNNDLLDREAAKVHEKLTADDSEGSLEASWRPYHDSFDNNENDVVTSIVDSFRAHVRRVSPLNLSGTVKLLKDLGRAEEAQAALQLYMEQRDGEGRGFFNLSEYAFGEDINDPDVRRAFDDKYRTFRDARSPAEILTRLSKRDSWSMDDIALLSALSVDDFYQLFKGNHGDNLSRIVRASLQFERIQGIDEETLRISLRAREALVRIGRESAINRRRVKKFGIEVPEQNS